MAADIRQEYAAAIEPDGGITVPAALIADKFELAPEEFMLKLRKGLVSRKTEEGVGEDAGRHRLTFEFSGRRVALVIGPSGEVVSCERTHPPDRKAPDAGAERIVDVREISSRVRHVVLLQLIENLGPGQSLQIRNDHDPVLLHGQVEMRHAGLYGWTYLEQGPDIWRVRISRPANS
jgi:uncharacterized protein (DUF2249 family)